MEERGMNERVRMLRRQSVETQPHIYMERAKLMTEAYKLYDGSMSVPESYRPQVLFPAQDHRDRGRRAHRRRKG